MRLLIEKYKYKIYMEKHFKTNWRNITEITRIYQFVIWYDLLNLGANKLKIFNYIIFYIKIQSL